MLRYNGVGNREDQNYILPRQSWKPLPQLHLPPGLRQPHLLLPGPRDEVPQLAVARHLTVCSLVGVAAAQVDNPGRTWSPIIIITTNLNNPPRHSHSPAPVQQVGEKLATPSWHQAGPQLQQQQAGGRMMVQLEGRGDGGGGGAEGVRPDQGDQGGVVDLAKGGGRGRQVGQQGVHRQLPNIAWIGRKVK